MDLNDYFQRIGLPELAAESLTPSLSLLQKLHLHHVLSIPFESLSIHIGEKITLDLHCIYQKIVQRRRGGFCYEHNGLFMWVLQELGYQPQVLSARCREQVSGVYKRPFDHMLLMVELEGRRWLCDVGHGDAITAPFPLEPGWEQNDINGLFRLQVEGDEWFLQRKDKEKDLWVILFKFTLEKRKYEDFTEMCEFQQTSSESLFVCKTLCFLQRPSGRLTYIGNCLVSTEVTEDGRTVKTTRQLTDEEITAMLEDTFGVVLTEKFIPKDEKVQMPTTE
ncbi:arylamine N-acetyltransferase, pineal gland isozyme NAT-3-like [Hyperolius riggenbachi]|uniref:arylamine N-acetyltransferase, pineal gland isozyme NAT-3-like n=1 Tax=Hyperolius riggenbachi TaxID=752182 RepID=UPI0035A298E4